MRNLWIHTGVFWLIATCVAADITFLSDRDGKRDIYVMNDDGSDVRRLTDTLFKIIGPTWSSDGRQIAFSMDLHSTDPKKWQQYDVFIMNPDGTGQRNLTQHPKLDGLPSFSPDGKYLAFDSSRAAHGMGDIFVMELTTRKVWQLTNGRFASSANYSPDGEKIAYESLRPGAGRHIYIMDVDGRRHRSLLRHPRHGTFGGTLLSFDPHWSPDGQRVVYSEIELVAGKGRVANAILIVDKDTRHLQVLDTPRNWKIDAVCWADDGDAVLFAAVRNGLVNKSRIFNIYKYRLSDGQITNLTDHPSDNWDMHWTPHNSLAVSAAAKLSTLWAEIKKSPE